MNKTLQLAGTVKEIFETQTFNSGFQKREFVITTTDERFQQDVKFELTKEKCSDLDSINQGDKLTVAFNVRGNEYNGKYYVNLQAWRIDKEGAQHEPVRPVQSSLPPAPNPDAAQPDADDDIPF